MSEKQKPKAVFTIREKESGEKFWTRIGSAFVNSDGSFNVLLDAVPLDGKLHIRDAEPRTEAREST